MEHLDRLIPLAVLGAVAVFLVFLVRRAAREQEAARPVDEVTPRFEMQPPEPIVIQASAPIEMPVVEVVAPPPKVEPAIVEAMPAVDALPVKAETPLKKPRRKKLARVKAAPAATPIQKVLELMKEKDSLAVAFVLREIFAPPVSLRLAPAKNRGPRGR